VTFGVSSITVRSRERTRRRSRAGASRVARDIFAENSLIIDKY